MDWLFLVRAIGTLTCLLGVALGIRLWFVRLDQLPAQKLISVGLTSLSAVAFYKLLAFATVVVVPAATMAVANYHTFVGVHEVAACAQCHVMRPMVHDLRDPASDNLAARHFKNGWIPTGQCYSCHSDYGFAGDMEAKMTGFRHLARYTTGRYTEPLSARTHFNNQQCLKCHEGKPPFENVHAHHDVIVRLRSSNMSCLNCHGKAHPTRADRTPGSARYDALVRAFGPKELPHE